MFARLLTTLVLAVGVVVAPTAQISVLPVDEVRPGMVGIGRTVFEGTTVEEFKVHILGVLKNVVGPRRNLVLARLEGGPLAQTGVIAGMSGSPVYVDGRLLGAISYSLGQFSKEPIAGITPIGEMTAATALAASAPGARPVDLPWPPTPRELLAIWSRDLGRTQPFAADPSQALLTPDATVTPGIAALLKPIAVPLVMAGFASDMIAPLTAAFNDRGFVPLSANQDQPTASRTGARNLQPGDAMGVALLQAISCWAPRGP
jgi:hypothetical protein